LHHAANPQLKREACPGQHCYFYLTGSSTAQAPCQEPVRLMGQLQELVFHCGNYVCTHT